MEDKVKLYGETRLQPVQVFVRSMWVRMLGFSIPGKGKLRITDGRNVDNPLFCEEQNKNEGDDQQLHIMYPFFFLDFGQGVIIAPLKEMNVYNSVK